MTNCQLPDDPSTSPDESIVWESDDGEDASKPPAPTAFGGWSDGMPFGDSPNYVPPYDPMKPLGGMQGTQTGEISPNVDNGVANPTAINNSAPSGDEKKERTK